MRRIVFLLIFLFLCPIDYCYSDMDLTSELSRTASDNYSIKVLLYHNISAVETDQNNPYVVSLAKFEEQMNWLKVNGYECVTVSDMFQKFVSVSS